MFRNNFKSTAMLTLAAALCFAPAALHAQGPDMRGGQDWRDRGPGGPPMERFHEAGPHFWSNPRIATAIGLTDDQKKKMDDIAQQHRLKLIDLNAALEKQEAIMHPLIEAEQPDESKILAQIDAVAQARAELEKDRARMLFSIRQVLTPDQWKKLKTVAHDGPGRFGGPGGPDGKGWRRGGPNGQGKAPNGQPPAPGGDQSGAPQQQPPSE
ncbi:Spy/CpxP family protein refolding chaperone [Silvibacterium dinghuense]|uniref:Periplasmic heavy metal sensor n=1 Tax=Silvibacterium dinghuense TaxID=1560006 RepID=A0A4Q1SK01_9BACT|nr:Spy/CpxP family protein refolding chaperone [Silvibacterium dinghuense]RXS97777.1 periplasmic heavy metal sensor [Silvibacterium dinghuense]GGH01924.1 hypothetical protein GCM10011586_17040 [Silvibacterium dinghuense]